MVARGLLYRANFDYVQCGLAWRNGKGQGYDEILAFRSGSLMENARLVSLVSRRVGSRSNLWTKFVNGLERESGLPI